MPSWVSDGFKFYQQRLPKHFHPELIEIPAVTRSAAMPVARAMQREGGKMMKQLQPDHYVVALDERGRQWGSKQLAVEMGRWQSTYKQVTFLIGGADGLSPECKARADQTWCLSQLTLPHAMVRVQVCEQIYRGWTILQGHPYHRE